MPGAGLSPTLSGVSPKRAPVLLTLLLLIVARPAGAAESPEDYDARITAELQATFPSAVPALARGNAAREADRNEEAIAAFEEVTRLAPDFTHGWRRLCQAETALERAEAVDHCRKALDLAELPENESALAGALLNIQGAERKAARARARYLATAAVEAAPDQLGGHLVLCRLAIEAQQQGELEACVKRLKGALPDAYVGYTFGAVLALSRQDFDLAQAELAEARARGLPDDEADRLEALVADSRPLSSKLWSATKRYGPPWFIGLVVIIVLGSALSAATLASARRNAQVVDARVSGLDALLRKLYRGVLWACCAYYFVSLPVVLGVVLLTAGGLLYAIFAIGHIPIKLVLIIIVVAAMTIFAILKGLIATFRSGVDEDPGERLDLAQHPRLAATLKEVADKIGTRPVDSVYLEPDVSVAVLERGGMLKQLSGRTERCLVLGVAALDGLKVDEFKAILGHEYGHFKNEDTAGGGFGLAVRRSMMTMGVQLAISGAAAWWNPAWLFFRGFFWVFMRISQGATRLQEVWRTGGPPWPTGRRPSPGACGTWSAAAWSSGPTSTRPSAT